MGGSFGGGGVGGGSSSFGQGSIGSPSRSGSLAGVFGGQQPLQQQQGHVGQLPQQQPGMQQQPPSLSPQQQSQHQHMSGDLMSMLDGRGPAHTSQGSLAAAATGKYSQPPSRRVRFADARFGCYVLVLATQVQLVRGMCTSYVATFSMCGKYNRVARLARDFVWAHVVFGLPTYTVLRQVHSSVPAQILSLHGSLEVSAGPRTQVGANESEAALAFDEADFPSLGGGPARPAGAPDGGGSAVPSPPSAQPSGAHSMATVFVKTMSIY